MFTTIKSLSFKFVLRRDLKPNKEGELPIYLQFCCKGKPIKKTTNIWIKPNYWSGDQNKPIKSAHKRSSHLNNQLGEFKHKYEVMFRNLPCNMDITPRLVKAIFDGTYGQDKKESEGKVDFVEYTLKFNEDQYEKGKISYSVWENVRCAMNKFKKYLKINHHSNIHCCEVNSAIIDGYIKWRREELENCNETINKALTPIFKALKSLAKKQWISPIIYEEMPEYLPSTPKSLDHSAKDTTLHFLMEEQLVHLKEIAGSSKDKRTLLYVDMFLFGVHTGMRISDILTLQWDDVDLEKQMIIKTMIKGHTRKQKILTIPLSQSAIGIMEKWHVKQSRFVFDCLQDDINLDDEVQLHTSNGNKNRAIQTSLRTIGKKMGLDFNLTMHVARHTFAILALNKGVNIHIISNVLGHSSIAVTEKVYAKFLPSTIRAELDEKLNFDF